MRLPLSTLLLGAVRLLVSPVLAEEPRANDDDRVPAGAPVVTIANGSYYGRSSPEYGQDFFLGVPFAQSPTGALRFAPPRPLNSTFGKARNATEYGPECIGYGFDQWILGNRISEDCLTINVVKPTGVSEGDALPVAVWIHGGVSK
jgi:carboxylesterase type B